jgi:hypothetical protein
VPTEVPRCFASSADAVCQRRSFSGGGRSTRTGASFVQSWLPGEPIEALDRPLLENLITLLERQADVEVRPDDWSLSWWVWAVVFDGWEDWWQDSARAAPQLTRRLHSFLEPAQGSSLPTTDIVHGHIGLRNVCVPKTRSGPGIRAEQRKRRRPTVALLPR